MKGKKTNGSVGYSMYAISAYIREKQGRGGYMTSMIEVGGFELEG
jgi:hypothetical protein